MRRALHKFDIESKSLLSCSCGLPRVDPRKCLSPLPCSPRPRLRHTERTLSRPRTPLRTSHVSRGDVRHAHKLDIESNTSRHSCRPPRVDLFRHCRSPFRALRRHSRRARALCRHFHFFRSRNVSCFQSFDLQKVLERLDRIGHSVRPYNDVVLLAS